MSSVKLSFFVKSKSNKKKQSPIVMTIIYDKLRTQMISLDKGNNGKTIVNAMLEEIK